MALHMRFSEEKNELLKATRGISFEEIILCIKTGDLLDDIVHHSKSRSNQRLYVVRIRHYVYVVPYVLDLKKDEIFLKTAYPSRSLMKLYKREGGTDE